MDCLYMCARLNRILSLHHQCYALGWYVIEWCDLSIPTWLEALLLEMAVADTNHGNQTVQQFLPHQPSIQQFEPSAMQTPKVTSSHTPVFSVMFIEGNISVRYGTQLS